MENVILTRVFISDQDKQGNKFVSKKGKPYKKIAIQCNEYEQKWLTSFIFDDLDPKNAWKQGMKVSIIVEENGQWLNFRLPTQSDLLEARVERLEKEVFKKEIPIVEPEDDGLDNLDDNPFA